MNPVLRSGILSPEEEQSLPKLVLHGIRDETPITMGWVPTLPWMILNLGRLHREGPLIMQKIDKNFRYNFAVSRLTQLILIDLFCYKVIFSGENPTWKFFEGGTSLNKTMSNWFN